MGDCRKTDAAILALMTLFTPWSSSVPLKSMNHTVKLYEPSPTPCLYVAPAENMMGRVPLIPLFLAGNSTPTIPHMFSKNKAAGFPSGCADAAALDGRRGSNIYEVNPSRRGCGGLGAASPALGACRSIRLQGGRMLSAMCGTSGQPRQNGLARRLYPDSK